MKIIWKITSVFKDDINTDDIIRADVLQESTDKQFFAKHAFEKFDSDFVERCSREKSSIVVAWKNFWCWSSREHAVYALSYNNVKCVIAESFPDIFYRNSFNNWFLLIILENPNDKFKSWDEIDIDLENRLLINKTQSNEFSFTLSDYDKGLVEQWWQIWLVKKYNESLKIDIDKKSVLKDCGQTIVEKIISKHVWANVRFWDTLSCLPIDLIYLNEVIWPAAIDYFIKDFWDSAKVFDRNKVLFIPDHSIPSCSVAVSEGIDAMSDFAKEQWIQMYKQWRWIEHIVFIEEWKVVPWSIVLWTDSHTCTAWAMNCLALWVWTTDSVYAIASWALFHFTVPETIKIVLEWKLENWVSAKDVILHLVWLIWAKWALKKVVEFSGPALCDMSIDMRTTLSNMVVEMSARTWIFPFDNVLKDYLEWIWINNFNWIKPDENTIYSKVVELNLSELEPMIAFPHSPENVCWVSAIASQISKSNQVNTKSFPSIEAEDLKVSQCFIWACTNWKFEDLKVAARILDWNTVHRDVNLVIVPASDQIYKKALNAWFVKIFIDSWAMIEAPNCWPCFWKHLWVASSRARILSSSNRNYKWRMWHKDSLIFLASPATVAASSIEWIITDPRKYLN